MVTIAAHLFHILKKHNIVSTARSVGITEEHNYEVTMFQLKRYSSSILLSVQNLHFEIIALIASCCLVMTAESRYRKRDYLGYVQTIYFYKLFTRITT